jgi:hypothetical protein
MADGFDLVVHALHGAINAALKTAAEAKAKWCGRPIELTVNLCPDGPIRVGYGSDSASVLAGTFTFSQPGFGNLAALAYAQKTLHNFISPQGLIISRAF